MASLANSAEGGSNTTLVSGANSGGASGDAWSSVNRTSAASAYTFSTTAPAHGSLGYSIQAASGEACQLIWTYVGGSGAASLFYYRHPGTPTITSEIAQIRNAGGNAAKINIGTDNKLVLTSNNANVRVSPTALVANDEVWISFRALKGGTTSTGTVEYAWGYKGSATIVDTFLSTTVNAGTADMTSSRFGRTTGSTWATTFYLDSIEAETSFSALIPSREQRNLSVSLATSGSGTTTLAGVPRLPAALAPSGSGTVALDGVPALPASLAPSGSGTTGLAGVPALPASLAPSGSGTTGLTGVPALTGTFGPSGSGTCGIDGTPGLPGACGLSGDGTVTVDGLVELWAALDLSGVGTLSIEGVVTVGGGPLVPLPHRLTISAASRSLGLATSTRTMALTSATRTLSFTNPPEED